VTFDWQSLANDVVLVAAAGGALVSIAAACRWCWHRLSLIIAMLERIMAEFQPNGGGSFKDGMNRMEMSIQTINRNVAMIGQRQLQMHNLDTTGIWETDANGLYTYVNPAMALLAGALPNDFLGMGWKNIIHEDDTAIFEQWRSAVDEKRDFAFDFRFRNGVAVHVSGKRLFAPDGTILGWIGDCHRQRLSDERKDKND
jgi:PAS domain S-box-containing protein